jgi:hypothetical protein
MGKVSEVGFDRLVELVIDWQDHCDRIDRIADPIVAEGEMTKLLSKIRAMKKDVPVETQIRAYGAAERAR